MPKSESLTVSLNLTKRLNEKLELYADALQRSKSNLCEVALNDWLDNCYNDLLLKSDPELLSKIIEYKKDNGEDTQKLEKLYDVLDNIPEIVDDAKKTLSIIEANKK